MSMVSLRTPPYPSDMISEGVRREELEKLTVRIGSESPRALPDDDTKLILLFQDLPFSVTELLIRCVKAEDAEMDLPTEATHIDKEYCYSILPLADEMKKDELYLVWAVLCCTLLELTFCRTISTFHTHNIGHLRKMKKLALAVVRVQSCAPHQVYTADKVENTSASCVFRGIIRDKKGERALEDYAALARKKR